MVAKKGATKPPPQNHKLKFRFLASISSAVGMWRSCKLVVIDGSCGDLDKVEERYEAVPSVNQDEEIVAVSTKYCACCGAITTTCEVVDGDGGGTGTIIKDIRRRDSVFSDGVTSAKAWQHW